MYNGEKFKIYLLGIKILKIKKIMNGIFEVYLFGLPLFSCRKVDNRVKINILVLQKIVDHYKKVFIKKKNEKSRLEILNKFKAGEKINICIQLSRPGMWNFDYLYPILKNNKQFNVSILIMPDALYKKELQQYYLQKTYQELKDKGYSPIVGYNFETNKCIDIRKEINPDIIFYTDFWKPHFYKEFYITEFLDKITFLTEYGFSVRQDEKTCNFELNNLVDAYFRPTYVHLDMCKKLMNNSGENVVITGSPKLDCIFDTDYKYNDIWKPQPCPKKRIIWAPHYNKYSPESMYRNDGFWVLYDFMLELAEHYKDTVQFVFRPHPVLYNYLVKEWGQDKTDEYYEKWNKLENGQYFDGNFVDLFGTSDAMIMDSCSFLAEYTATNKPLFYTRTSTSRLNLNEFGEKLFEHVYDTEGDLVLDIENFIKDVVINGNDYKKEGRTKFVQKYFGKINGKTASENIYDEIINFLEKGDI